MHTNAMSSGIAFFVRVFLLELENQVKIPLCSRPNTRIFAAANFAQHLNTGVWKIRDN